jgi:hypothetical protein
MYTDLSLFIPKASLSKILNVLNVISELGLLDGSNYLLVGRIMICISISYNIL